MVDFSCFGKECEVVFKWLISYLLGHNVRWYSSGRFFVFWDIMRGGVQVVDSFGGGGHKKSRKSIRNHTNP